MRAGKLILVLDLDHTLIHTVQGVIKGPDIVHFEIDGNFYSTKRRPHLENFLEKLQEKYEMCVYTMGTLKYAGQIVHIIDPDHCYFGDRVISK